MTKIEKILIGSPIEIRRKRNAQPVLQDNANDPDTRSGQEAVELAEAREANV